MLWRNSKQMRNRVMDFYQKSDKAVSKALGRQEGKISRALQASVKVRDHDLNKKKNMIGSIGRLQGQNQEENKGPSHICYKESWWFPRILRKYSCRLIQVHLKTNKAFQRRYIIPTVKHPGGGVMICFIASGAGDVTIIYWNYKCLAIILWL